VPSKKKEPIRKKKVSSSKKKVRRTKKEIKSKKETVKSSLKSNDKTNPLNLSTSQPLPTEQSPLFTPT